MALYLNTNAAYKDFQMLSRDKYFVDKSASDSTPEAAIKQIKDKEYSEKLLKEGVENILLVGISYDTTAKQHQCRIEKVDGSSGAVEGTR